MCNVTQMLRSNISISFQPVTMSLASEAVNNPAMDDLVQSCYVNERNKLEWIPYEEITNVKPTQIDNVYYAIRKRKRTDDETITLVLLGSSRECTATLVSEFARIYSLPTCKYNKDVSQF